jgi:hypothetical protein
LEIAVLLVILGIVCAASGGAVLVAGLSRGVRARLFLLIEASVLFAIAAICFAGFVNDDARRHIGFLLGGTILANMLFLKLVQRSGRPRRGSDTP